MGSHSQLVSGLGCLSHLVAFSQHTDRTVETLDLANRPREAVPTNYHSCTCVAVFTRCTLVHIGALFGQPAGTRQRNEGEVMRCLKTHTFVCATKRNPLSSHAGGCCPIASFQLQVCFVSVSKMS